MTNLTGLHVTWNDRATCAGKAVFSKLDQAARHIDARTSTAFTQSIALATSLATSVRTGFNITDDWLKQAPGKAGKRMGFVGVLDVITGPISAAKYGVAAGESYKVGAVRQTVMRGVQAASGTLKGVLGVMFISTGILALADTFRIVHISTIVLSKVAGGLGLLKIFLGTLPNLYKLWVTYDLFQQAPSDHVQLYRNRLQVDIKALYGKCDFEQKLTTKEYAAILKEAEAIKLTDQEKSELAKLKLDFEQEKVLMRDVIYAKRANELDLKCALGSNGLAKLKASDGRHDAELALELQAHMKFRLLKTGFMILLDVISYAGLVLALLAGSSAIGPLLGAVATALWIFSSVAETGLTIRRYFKARGAEAAYDKYIFMMAMLVFLFASTTAVLVSGSGIVGFTMAGLGVVMMLILLDTYACAQGFDVFVKLREYATRLRHEPAG